MSETIQRDKLTTHFTTSKRSIGTRFKCVRRSFNIPDCRFRSRPVSAFASSKKNRLLTTHLHKLPRLSCIISVSASGRGFERSQILIVAFSSHISSLRLVFELVTYFPQASTVSVQALAKASISNVNYSKQIDWFTFLSDLLNRRFIPSFLFPANTHTYTTDSQVFLIADVCIRTHACRHSLTMRR